MNSFISLSSSVLQEEPSKQTVRCQRKATNARNVSWIPVTFHSPARRSPWVWITSPSHCPSSWIPGMKTCSVKHGRSKVGGETNTTARSSARWYCTTDSWQQWCYVSAFTFSARAQARKIPNINDSSPADLRKQLIPITTLKLPGDELKGQLPFPFLIALHLKSHPSYQLWGMLTPPCLVLHEVKKNRPTEDYRK